MTEPTTISGWALATVAKCRSLREVMAQHGHLAHVAMAHLTMAAHYACGMH